MIIKSMSRKEPSFDQLVAYMSSEKSDTRYDMYHHCFSRNHGDIVREFLENSQLLAKRKNGNYLYHEIVSILVQKGMDRRATKESLRDISQRYIEARCPRNIVYGCLHEDHDHNLHYHLLISANERGERKRTRLTQRQFDSVKRELEKHVLEHYPELKQKALINVESTKEKMSTKAGEMKRRTGALPHREEIRKTLEEGMSQTSSMDNFCFFLSERGYQFYVRGKNFGVAVSHEDRKTKKYRFSTLGVHEDFLKFQAKVLSSKEPSQKFKEETVSQKTSSETFHETSFESSQSTKAPKEKTKDAETQAMDDLEEEFHKATDKKQSSSNSDKKHKP